jgi:hypothetical protein
MSSRKPLLQVTSLMAALLLVGCTWVQSKPTPTPTSVPATDTPTPVPPTPTPTPLPPTPTLEVMPGPEGWTLYVNEDFHITLYHPPDWSASVKTEEDGTKMISVAAPEVGSLDIAESPFLKRSSPEEWADGLIEQFNEKQPGAWSFERLGPATTLDGGDGYAFEAQSTEFSIRAFKGVVIYDETAFQVTGIYGGFANDEALIAGYKGIFETIQIAGAASLPASGPADIPTPANTSLPTAATVPPPTATATPSSPTVVAQEGGVSVRSGPGTNFAMVGQLEGGASARITGRYEDWWQIDYHGTPAWISDWVVTANNAEDVPEVPPPPTPTPS